VVKHEAIYLTLKKRVSRTNRATHFSVQYGHTTLPWYWCREVGISWGIAMFQLASKQVAWKVYSWVQQNRAIGNQNFLDTVGWVPNMVGLVGWTWLLYGSKKFILLGYLLFLFPFLSFPMSGCTQFSFSLILTPNVPTAVCERCMIKHEATSSYAITHFTCDIGSIDHLPYSIS
jgi:hypothetical protein